MDIFYWNSISTHNTEARKLDQSENYYYASVARIKPPSVWQIMFTNECVSIHYSNKTPVDDDDDDDERMNFNVA